MTSVLRCDQLETLLRGELTAASGLHALLLAEESAIAARDVDAMQQIVADKQPLLAELESLHQRHAALLAAAGMADDKSGLEAAAQECKGGLPEVWSQLQQGLAECQRQNQINGRLLTTSQLHTQRALSILLGRQGEADELYTADGRAAPAHFGGSHGIKV